MQESRRPWVRLGFIVFVIGTLSNIGQFALANLGLRGIVAPIAVLALIDAALIAYVSMHIRQLWHAEE